VVTGGLRALGHLTAVLLTSASLAFLCLQLAPGDAGTALGEGLSPAARSALRVRYGLEQPLAVQYLRWLSALAQGDLGWSTSYHQPVWEVLTAAFGRTLWIVTPAFVLSLLGGMWVGTWQGLRAGSRGDRVATWITLAIHATPDVALASLVLLVGAGLLSLFPTGGMTSDLYPYLPTASQWLDRLQHLVLPVLTISLVGVATVARHQRASLRDALRLPFMTLLPARGLPPTRIRWHAWRNALPPVLSVAGVLLPSWLAGLVFVEQVFAWPGMGYLLVQAIAAQDMALVAGAVLLASACALLIARVAAAARGVADPRLAPDGRRAP
jgi:peptide/nickel transport system permease protein